MLRHRAMRLSDEPLGFSRISSFIVKSDPFAGRQESLRLFLHVRYQSLADSRIIGIPPFLTDSKERLKVSALNPCLVTNSLYVLLRLLGPLHCFAVVPYLKTVDGLIEFALIAHTYKEYRFLIHLCGIIDSKFVHELAKIVIHRDKRFNRIFIECRCYLFIFERIFCKFELCEMQKPIILRTQRLGLPTCKYSGPNLELLGIECGNKLSKPLGIHLVVENFIEGLWRNVGVIFNIKLFPRFTGNALKISAPPIGRWRWRIWLSFWRRFSAVSDFASGRWLPSCPSSSRATRWWFRR